MQQEVYVRSQGEGLAYQMDNGASAAAVSGPMALLKVMASKTFEYCAREASQIIGGSSYTREGKVRVFCVFYDFFNAGSIGTTSGTAVPGSSFVCYSR